MLVLGVILVACCMVYQKNRTSSGPESTRSNRTRYYRLSLPYPSDRNESPSLEKGEHRRENEGTPIIASVLLGNISVLKYFRSQLNVHGPIPPNYQI